MGVRFDYNGCIIALRLSIMKALKQMQKEYMEQAKSEGMGSHARGELAEGEFEFISSAIAITVIGGPWVVMNEFGTGSLLDLSNPALADYIRSDLFNPIRRIAMGGIGFARVGRAKGTYVDIFGKTVKTSGKLAGVNLEWLAEKGKLPKSFLPTPPRKSLETAARWMAQKRASEILQEAVATVPWGNFIVAFRD